MRDQEVTRVDVLLAVAYDPDPRARRESQALAEAGYAVRILAWDRDGTRRQHERDGNVLVQRIVVHSTWGRGPAQAVFLVILAWRLMRYVRRRKPHVLHAVDLPMLLIALCIAPFAGRPVVVYDAFEIYSVMTSERMPRIMSLIIAWLERRLPRLADLVITPAESRQRYFQERGVPSVIVANWIDPPKTSLTRRQARRALGVESDRFVIAYVGSIHPSRDLDSLIDHARRYPLDLVLIAGAGEDEERIDRLSEHLDNVRMLGWLRNPDPVVSAADVLYYALREHHPYAAFAAPNNLFVAIAHAIPLVYRPQGEQLLLGSRHTIGRKFTDADSLDVALNDLRDPNAQLEVRASLRALQGDYSWSRAADTLLAVYPKKGTDAKRARVNGP